MKVQAIDYLCGNTRMTGHLADGSGGAPAIGILVAHEASGLTEHARGRADALAAEGHVAFALDLFGDDVFPEGEARARYERVMSTPGLMIERARAGLKVLMAQPNVDPQRVGVIGFCLGGIVALELARHGAPVRCAVGFHPAFTRPAGSPDARIDAEILMMVGSEDPFVGADDREGFRQSMEASGADWQLHVFGGVGHSYTNPAVDALNLPGLRYDARADRRAWRMMRALLEDVFTRA